MQTKENVCFIFTDGGAVSNGKGGYYAASGYNILCFKEKNRLCGVQYHGNKTNNYSELWAINESLKLYIQLTKETNCIHDRVVLYTDSLLCVNSLLYWMPGWIKNSVNGVLMKGDKKPVLNQELLKEIWESKKILGDKLHIMHISSHIPKEKYKMAYNKFLKINRIDSFDYDTFIKIIEENEKVDNAITKLIEDSKS